MNTALGCDISAWQDAPETAQFIDFSKAIAAGVKFVIVRAAYGLAADRIFTRAYDDAKKAGLITGVYQYADYRTTAKANVAALKVILAGRVPDLVAIDLEQNEAYWPGKWPENTAALTVWVKDYQAAYRDAGIKSPLMLYTNPTTIKQMRQAPDTLASLAETIPLWVALYNASGPVPADIAPWKRYHIWQPAPSAVGKQYGMESGNLDLDYWQGTLEELKAFVGQAVDGPVDPVPVENYAEELRMIAARLAEIAGKLPPVAKMG